MYFLWNLITSKLLDNRRYPGVEQKWAKVSYYAFQHNNFYIRVIKLAYKYSNSMSPKTISP